MFLRLFFTPFVPKLQWNNDTAEITTLVYQSWHILASRYFPHWKYKKFYPCESLRNCQTFEVSLKLSLSECRRKIPGYYHSKILQRHLKVSEVKNSVTFRKDERSRGSHTCKIRLQTFRFHTWMKWMSVISKLSLLLIDIHVSAIYCTDSKRSRNQNSFSTTTFIWSEAKSLSVNFIPPLTFPANYLHREFSVWNWIKVRNNQHDLSSSGLKFLESVSKRRKKFHSNKCQSETL